ncbi:MAG: twin-arginine translocation signal domain-containing protein [Acidimicrobiales bacterium]
MAAPTERRPLTERLVERASGALDRRTDRRSVLQAAAVVGSALATGGVGYILRPGTAYASVCGDGASCTSGWTAFCCTVHGANTCPPYSFAAGWWKIDASPFCSGAARYIVDCNATCPTQCSCHCASGTCDERRVCCNQFRYGQCNTQIACYGPVVCRIALCTAPWIWSSKCTTTSRTDNRTVTHNAPCLVAVVPPCPPAGSGSVTPFDPILSTPPGQVLYVPLTPARLMDSRPGAPTVDGQAAGGGAVEGCATRTVTVAGRGGVPASGVATVVLNVTVTGPTTEGFLTVFPAGESRPPTSNVNFRPGQTVANAVICRVGADGQVSIHN